MFDNIEVLKEYNSMLLLDKSPLTIRLYNDALNRFFTFLKVETDNDIKNVTPSKCREYQTSLKESGLQPASVNSHTRALRAFYNWICFNEYIEKNPFLKIKNVKEPKREKAYLDEDEIAAMINGCKNIEEKTIIAIMLSLGLRRSELTNLKVSDIDGTKVKIIGKGDKERTLYLQESTYDLVQEYLANRKYSVCEYLFCKVGKKYSNEAIRLKIKSIAKRGGISEEKISSITPHTMRRTFCTNLITQNVNMRIVQYSMGHANMSTTLIYSNVTNPALENAMKNQKDIVK